MTTVPFCRGFALLEVSVPHSMAAVDVVAVIFSFVPWVGSSCLIAAAAITQRYMLKLCTGLLLLLLSTNELVLKKVLAEPRPSGSCLASHGMPSSHSLLSVGLLVYIVLEAIAGDIDIRLFRLSSSRRKYAVLVGLTCLLVPVPFSRVYLEDHSTAQAAFGSFAGAVGAVLYFVAHAKVRRRRHRHRRESKAVQG